ncbi:tetratricopeptide repeat protein [Polynucleobacter sp. AP-Sving-400A-A2]|uniref:tetratricopeptide repeat protein n=1 Tax=Polynucleobacter sp. AP-Sving-400A-A2 TaxID=2081049 RepID=UPI001BFD473E|nr:tetratricopeptide repeat protein [Polynucleobacter sp. AP-Sving-400A-A2]QWE14024.1 tetratricopeptide repeat protein [Polynucleobacter sp. AP-Sving-400A-A2]
MRQLLGSNFASKLLASILLASAPWVVSLAADSAPTKADPVWLTDTRASIKSNNYEQALKQLQSANEVNSADWNNLMGYSLRKKQPPDLAASEKYYQAALKIDPSHRSALEYYGELLLMKKDLPGAEAMLARLDKACRFGCEEYSDLKESIAKYQGKK